MNPTLMIITAPAVKEMLSKLECNPMANNPAVAAAALQRQVQAQVQAAAFQAAAQGASAAALWGTQQTRGRSDRVEVIFILSGSIHLLKWRTSHIN